MAPSWAADRALLNSHPPTANKSAAAAANARARRSRMGMLRALPGVTEPVADAPDRLDVVPAERRVDLAPQVVHVLVDDVRAAVIGEVPHRLDDLRAGKHVAGMPKKQLKQGELLRGKPQFGLRHRNFRLFIGGQIISLVGTWMQNVALSWLVYRLTHSALLLGNSLFSSQIAVFALGPLGGIAADRFPRQKVVIVTQTLSMVQAFVLAALTLTGRVQVWQVLVLAGVLGVINAFDMPGRQALVILMTSKEDLINAISLNSAVFNSARVVGPAIAGLLLAVVGEGTCFLINGISFLAVILCLTAMRIPPAAPQ